MNQRDIVQRKTIKSVIKIVNIKNKNNNMDNTIKRYALETTM